MTWRKLKPSSPSPYFICDHGTYFIDQSIVGRPVKPLKVKFDTLYVQVCIKYPVMVDFEMWMSSFKSNLTILNTYARIQWTRQVCLYIGPTLIADWFGKRPLD